jgi:hypothetical protein
LKRENFTKKELQERISGGLALQTHKQRERERERDKNKNKNKAVEAK